MNFKDRDFSPDGVSLWDHVTNGAQTGFEGSLGNPFLAVPGMIGGGALGLANGLHDLYEEHEDRELWKRTMAPDLRRYDDETAARAQVAGTPEQQRAIWGDHDRNQETEFQRERAQERKALGRGESWFDHLF